MDPRSPPVRPAPASPSARRRAALVGLLGLAAAMGIGRFAFTPLLPLMQAEGLTLQQGTWLSSANYLGYLLGALACTFHRRLCPEARGAPKAWRASHLLTLLMGLGESFAGPWMGAAAARGRGKRLRADRPLGLGAGEAGWKPQRHGLGLRWRGCRHGGGRPRGDGRRPGGSAARPRLAGPGRSGSDRSALLCRPALAGGSMVKPAARAPPDARWPAQSVPAGRFATAPSASRTSCRPPSCRRWRAS